MTVPLRIVKYLDVTLSKSDVKQLSLDLATKQILLFSTLTKNLISPCQQHLLINGFQTIILIIEDTLHKAGYIDKVVYRTPHASNQESKSKNH